MSDCGYDPTRKERLKAMRGDVSFALDLDLTHNRGAVIYGIRHSLKLAQSDVIATLCSGQASTKNLDFCRARNARLIMSGVMPSEEEMGSFEAEERMTTVDAASTTVCDLDSTLKRPYCIWHPDRAPEGFYRSLVAKYPSLCYQVARACAAAGYSTLYHELATSGLILPEVSIAEEARESGITDGKVIYNTIMSAPARYQVMDDYTRSVAVGASYANTPPAFLNGDTVVRWIIEEQALLALERSKGLFNRWRELPRREFITEAGGITLTPPARRRLWPKLNDDEIALLHSPLPRDLPTMNKTLLISMAAYNGDVDRYTRLVNRREAFYGIDQIIRGIHWNPLFARFWAQQLDEETDFATRVKRRADRDLIRKAISARRIMCNDLSEFLGSGWDLAKPKPFLIWWPHHPRCDTMLELHRWVPEMEETLVIAALMMKDDWLVDRWLPTCTVTQGIYVAAYQTKSKRTKEIEQRLEAVGIEPDILALENSDYAWLHQLPDRDAYDYVPPICYAELADCLESIETDDYEDYSRTEFKTEHVYLRIFTTKDEILETIAKEKGSFFIRSQT